MQPDMWTTTREIYWNISKIEVALMYLSFVVALAIFGYGLWQRVRYWRAGRGPKEPWTDWGRRFGLFFKETMLQSGVLREGYPGVMHGFIFFSFLVLVVTTATVFLNADFGLEIFHGLVYLVLSLGSDVGGVLVLVGLGMAAWRRYGKKPESLDRKGDDAFVLWFLAGIVVTGFLAEGLRIRFEGEQFYLFSPVGWILSLAFAPIGEGLGQGLHKGLWWVHMVSAMGFIAIIPYTKFFHIVSLPTNVFLANLSGNPALRRVDLDAMMNDPNFDANAFSVGVGSAKDFEVKDRLDHDACIACGRCENNCPAAKAGDPFSPKRFIQMLRDYGHTQVQALEALNRKALPAPAADGSGSTEAAAEAPAEGTPAVEIPPIIDGTLPNDFVWFCRTCRACVEACPAKIDHVTQFVEVRRNEVMMNGRLPEEAMMPLRTLETSGNGFGNQEDRVAFVEKAGFPVVAAGEKVEVLYFIGCLTSFDQTKQKIAQDLGKLLDLAGVKWGVLGMDETCCGDPARAMGNEMLFQTVAKAQLEAIKAREFTTLLVSCPHCFHVLANEYKSFAADLPVVHHTQYLQRLIADGRLKLPADVKRRITFHDPCYLGRYQGEYEAPRAVLSRLPGASVTEMADRREKSLCCGGGGGHFWMDFKAPRRINNLRVEQAVAAGADTIAVGCPFCHQMLSDSLSILDLTEKLKVTDLATLTLEAAEKRTEA